MAAADKVEAELATALTCLRTVAPAELGAAQERRLRVLIEQLRAQVGALARERDDGAFVEPPPTLLTLPPELLVRILSFLEAPSDFARVACVCWRFRGMPSPPPMVPVESALRERAARLGLLLPSGPAPTMPSWTGALLRDERERQAISRASPFSAAAVHVASISAKERLVTFGLIESEFMDAVLDTERLEVYDVVGQLGHGVRRPEDTVNVLEPSLVGHLCNVPLRSVSAGLLHTVVVSGRGRVYTFGCGHSGRLGHGDERVRIAPKLVKGLEMECALSAAAGHSHSLIVTQDGRLFGCGLACRAGVGLASLSIERGSKPLSFRQLIALDTVRRSASEHGARSALAAESRPLCNGSTYLLAMQAVLTPRQLGGALEGRCVVAASARGFHSLALDADGRVYSWGSGNEHGELGREPPPAPQGLPTVSECGAYLEAQLQIRECPPELLECAYLQTAALPLYEPGLVDALRGVRVECVSAGFAFSAAVAADGRLFTWGDNSEGQLGHGDLVSRARPAAVRGDLDGVPMLSVSAGYYGCLALSAERQAYSWGNAGEPDSDGETYVSPHWLCGHGSRRGCRTPRLLIDLSDDERPSRHGERLAWLSAGRHASFVATTSGRIFAWGEFDYTGLPEDADGVPEVPAHVQDEAELAMLLSALQSRRISMAGKTYVVRPEQLARPLSRLGLPPMDEMLRIFEARAEPPRARLTPGCSTNGSLDAGGSSGSAAGSGGPRRPGRALRVDRSPSPSGAGCASGATESLLDNDAMQAESLPDAD